MEGEADRGRLELRLFKVAALTVRKGEKMVLTRRRFLPSGPPGTPRTRQQMGSANHFSLGVIDMAATAATLKSANRLCENSNGPKIHREGKWQFNIFDPDRTRAELMEFGNVEPPCCSQVTAPNRSPPTW
jgi:hypothetical protein